MPTGFLAKVASTLAVPVAPLYGAVLSYFVFHPPQQAVPQDARGRGHDEHRRDRADGRQGAGPAYLALSRRAGWWCSGTASA
jgi:hypothetical protein